MNFLQPLLLAGLPLAALPIVIHLINRQRHRTKRWAAMMFLLSAKRMSRGMARLRQILIMAMRMLAVAALIFAISRPLASGWLGLAAGGRPATVLLLLDRSPSMEAQDLQAGESKRSTGLKKLVQLLTTLGPSTRLVLLESTEQTPREIESPETLLEHPEVVATAAPADIAGMLQKAAEYIEEHQTGRTDIWICSDMRVNDWNPQSGRWGALRQAVGQLQGVRVHLLNYTDPPADNVAVRVSRVIRRQVDDKAELIFDIQLRRDRKTDEPRKVPLGVVINGARSVLNVEMTDLEYKIQGQVIPLDAETKSGWGRVEIPSDANPEDNVYYFAFGPPPLRRTVVVSDDPQSSEPLRLAAGTPVEPGVEHEATVLTSDRVDEIDWDATAMIIWQAPLPDGPRATLLEQFQQRGRALLFFPPAEPNDNVLFGAKWGAWREAQADAPVVVSSYREDAGLLANTLSGDSLPVGQLKTQRYCALENAETVLARFEGGDPLLAKVETETGSVHFCSTLPRATHSSLARDGVVFYVMLQRGLESGAASLGSVRQLPAGGYDADTADWQPMPTGQRVVLSTARQYHAGVYQAGDRLFAINRPLEEDETRTIAEADIDGLFSGLDYHVVNDQLGSVRKLASEIWRGFLLAMAIALVVEAALCMPPRTQTQVALHEL